ncbi:hypothetical protein AALO_G00242590 [Alosa alosa]|uniref:Kinesin-like protein n=2 Tax=Alosa TaxID=34772 RepID=A0AAV6FWA9_9TELE|nr:kinesin-like protein KIF6 isoform X1 [Alosa sapidissima]XP_041927881.1 kinesin-like protein KIF6 isoform X1 [Alosa sapidissima]XP_048084617.1 kinesin-like protein KIF6 [Alosa alosa]XP_048084618.1 kinesin-like protein KIF6 [Alosa alosa]XP_048084619.1 kinesin-like protein KIF6 [Alosa alosa]KAG5265447.1 hypothetical protein AALO_G00242590 [Alosa alosa]
MVKQAIQIFARVKPNKKSVSAYSVDEDGHSLEFEVPKDLADGFINNKKDKYRFRFQKIFDQACKQEDVFEMIAKPVADRVLSGYNGTIFAYGQTGSGKTFTITGGAERYSDRGIIPRTLSYLYQHFSQDKSMVYTTHISYLEIYNEMGFDLLDPRQEASTLEDLPKVTILEDTEQNIHLKNLSLLQSDNEEEALNLLFLGDTNRMIAETPMNQASTRSHCIFTIHLCSREPGSATVRRSKLHLVDLAGSERVGKTGVGGQQLTEAKYINLSLHYLEQVIIALSEKNRSHIPYRNSMMTSVLRDSLGGNCMTTMIATVSVDTRNLDESISTCRFAQRVAQIKNEALLNEELDPTLLITRLKKEVQTLKDELAMITGEQRSDVLTPHEIQRLQEQVKVFLDDADPEVKLELGPDMRKNHYCFSLLKAKICERPSSYHSNGDSAVPPGSTVTDHMQSSSPTELKKLKDMLTQRDNEISILVSMLKKEKKRAQEALAQLSQWSPASSTATLPKDLSIRRSAEELPPLQKSLYRKQDPEFSIGRQEAFDIFKRDHGDQLIIDENKVLLKQRYSEAKALGEKVNNVRSKVNELKTQLELRRRQIAVQGVTTGSPVSEQADPVEERLLAQIEEEKNNYKSTFGRLKGLKTEIEHLQLLLEKAKIKLHKDFQDWWKHEAKKAQVAQPDPQHPVLEVTSTVPKSTTTVSSNPVTRSLTSSSLSDSSIPLTGDRETDEDILAFIRARQSLLNRAGALK